MAIAASLLKILVCPISHGPLELVRSEAGVERLYSPEVGVFFPIQAPDIPVLVPECAVLEDGSSAASPIAVWRERSRII